jgi:hypothetical protein
MDMKSDECHGCAAFRDATQGLISGLDADDPETVQLAVRILREILESDAGRELANYLERVELMLLRTMLIEAVPTTFN